MNPGLKYTLGRIGLFVLCAVPALLLFPESMNPLLKLMVALIVVAITSGFAMAFAVALAALGQGRVASAACEGMARNPAARPGIQLALILGLAFIESLVLFTLLIIFVKVVK